MSLTDLTDKIFSEIVESAKEKYRRENWRGTFDQFLAKLAENPERYLRTSYKYIYDAIVHFGKEEIKDCGETLPHYHVFDDPFGNGRKKIFGQHRLLESLVDEIRSSAEEEGPERIILLHGPPGTAKTSIMYLISKAMEFYSRTEEGELLRFKWKISNRPIDPGRQSKIGFQTESGEDGEKSSSKKKKSPKKRGVEMVCSLNDNPIFLIPAEQREEFLRKIIGDRDITVPKKILEGEICYNCRQIYNALLDKYHGDLEKVFQHIVVERFFIEDNQGFIDRAWHYGRSISYAI
ncbi:MAG: hypothetical protein DRP29_06280 [Thermodesulfobacteriota bacterium]|nr:MAG: hypothetical protein DRP29_06280 [Thermodesulfobacteriota bacterium]